MGCYASAFLSEFYCGRSSAIHGDETAFFQQIQLERHPRIPGYIAVDLCLDGFPVLV